MAEKMKALVVQKDRNIRQYALQSPQQLKAMANVVKDYIVKNELSVQIQGHPYAMVEGWQFAGSLLGTTPLVTEVVDMTKDPMKPKWLAKVEITELKSGKVVGRGMALCSKTESKKASFDEYAILSMAQTRAIGKAYRNVIGWLMKMAGYEGTPAEEMVVAPAAKPAPESTYNKALAMVAKTNTIEELEQIEASLKKGRGAKLYNAEQREQLMRMIAGRKLSIENGA